MLTFPAVLRSYSLRRDVAQSGSALEWGSRGRRFKSFHPDQKARQRDLRKRKSLFRYGISLSKHFQWERLRVPNHTAGARNRKPPAMRMVLFSPVGRLRRSLVRLPPGRRRRAAAWLRFPFPPCGPLSPRPLLPAICRITGACAGRTRSSSRHAAPTGGHPPVQGNVRPPPCVFP